jgi:hypothetical protein
MLESLSILFILVASSCATLDSTFPSLFAGPLRCLNVSAGLWLSVVSTGFVINGACGCSSNVSRKSFVFWTGDQVIWCAEAELEAIKDLWNGHVIHLPGAIASSLASVHVGTKNSWGTGCFLKEFRYIRAGRPRYTENLKLFFCSERSARAGLSHQTSLFG